LKNERSKQKTKCQKYFHHQKLRQKIRLKCENCTKGEYYFKQVVITGVMNSRLFISQSQKSYCNDHKADTGNGWWQNFAFCSKIDHVKSQKYKQDSGDYES